MSIKENQAKSSQINPVASANDRRRAKLSSPFFIWPATVVLAALLFAGLDYFFAALTHESTDDAFIAGHIVFIAPRISGQVAAVHVLDNQMVHSNDLLVEIDPADYAITVAQKQSMAEAADANVKTILAADELMRKKVATAEAVARAAQADADASEAGAKLAAKNFERAGSLLKDKTISQQEFDSAQAANNSAQANLISAQQNVAEENSKVDESRSQLAAAEAEIGLAKALWEESQTNIASAQLNLSYTKIFAPGDGRVTRKQVEAGDYLQAGQQIMSIVPVEVWVVANFKESQLKKMKPGQGALVEIDALGGRKFRAHVDSVQAGSGAAFSLLPPENATGNFVKVIQRVPVKIVFDEPLPADHVIGPGLSVTPSVLTGSSSRVPDFVTAILAVILAVVAAVVFRFILNRKTDGNGK
jgi:membrane fusion protein (multidrug efflux system)